MAAVERKGTEFVSPRIVRLFVLAASAAIAARLYTSKLPDPDLLIRTSGEMRGRSQPSASIQDRRE